MMAEKPDNQHDQRPSGTGEKQANLEETAQGSPDLEQLQNDLAEARKSADAIRDQLLRKAAEFENYKRRTETEFVNTIRNANESLIAALLPVLDDLDRSLKAGRSAREFDSFFKGVELIQSKFYKILEAKGLAAFESAGKPFDVDYHDALLQVPRADVPPNTVIEEIERGYKLNDKMLRHAKVIVSVPPEGDAGPVSTPPENNDADQN